VPLGSLGSKETHAEGRGAEDLCDLSMLYEMVQKVVKSMVL
jgi:hypothetical protein